MITITVTDFVKFTKVKRDWIITKCTPSKNKLASQGIRNLYDVEHILLTAKRIEKEVMLNHKLAASKKLSALKTLKQIIVGIEKYNRIHSALAA